MAKKPNGQIVIDKNIPLTPLKRRGPKGKYPWATMKVGDSFYCDTRKDSMDKLAQYHKHEGKFVARMEGKGCRVWRVE